MRVELLLLPEWPHPKGRYPWTPARQVLDGIFYRLRTGCQSKALPRSLGAPSTIHDRFQEWTAARVFERLWQALDGAMTKAPLGGEKLRR